MAVWEELVNAYKKATIDAPDLKPVTLAQWILESGRGTSELAMQHYNFGGLKYRGRMKNYAEPVYYQAHDGQDTYCKFPSAEEFIRGYWHFVKSGPYPRWANFATNPVGYIHYIYACGYASNPAYVEKVMGLIEEAENLLASPEPVTPHISAPNHISAPDSVSAPDNVIAKLGIVVGHNAYAKGAYARSPIWEGEYPFNYRVAEYMKAVSQSYSFESEIFTRTFQRSTSEEIREVYRKADNWGADITIELHFNACDDPTVRGTETLANGSSESMTIARFVQKEVVELFHRGNDRGVKVPEQGENGYLSLHSGKAPAILTEPFFGSNRDECVAMSALGEDALAKAYLRGLQAAMAYL